MSIVHETISGSARNLLPSRLGIVVIRKVSVDMIGMILGFAKEGGKMMVIEGIIDHIAVSTTFDQFAGF